MIRQLVSGRVVLAVALGLTVAFPAYASREDDMLSGMSDRIQSVREQLQWCLVDSYAPGNSIPPYQVVLSRASIEGNLQTAEGFLSAAEEAHNTDAFMGRDDPKSMEYFQDHVNASVRFAVDGINELAGLRKCGPAYYRRGR